MAGAAVVATLWILDRAEVAAFKGDTHTPQERDFIDRVFLPGVGVEYLKRFPVHPQASERAFSAGHLYAELTAAGGRAGARGLVLAEHASSVPRALRLSSD